jgi:hypothetical protein
VKQSFTTLFQDMTSPFREDYQLKVFKNKVLSKTLAAMLSARVGGVHPIWEVPG